MFSMFLKIFCRKGKHIFLRIEVRLPGSTVLCCISYWALLGKFIYTRQQIENSVNYIHSIRHYNCPKYNSQLETLELREDTAQINKAEQSTVNEQCKNEGYFNESMSGQSMHPWTTDLMSELTQYCDDITILILHHFDTQL